MKARKLWKSSTVSWSWNKTCWHSFYTQQQLLL